jgi:hypothetical protein
LAVPTEGGGGVWRVVAIGGYYDTPL